MDRINDILAGLFEGASVVVKDQVLGYRRKKDQFVLMVEAFGDEAAKSGPFVVKIGPESKIKGEIHGWNSCRPPGLKHDLVFLDLHEGRSLKRDGEDWLSLIYGDAQQFLGVTATVTLEEAALECVRSGFPRILSIEFVIVELFERIGHLLYSQAFVDDPARKDYVFDLPKLDGSLACWENDPACQAVRREANTLVRSGVEQFLDPVDYLRYIQTYVPWKIAGPDGTIAVRPATAPGAATALPGLPPPLPVTCHSPAAPRLRTRRPAWAEYSGGNRSRPGHVADRLRLRRHGPRQPDRVGFREAGNRAENPRLSERLRRRNRARLRPAMSRTSRSRLASARSSATPAAAGPSLVIRPHPRIASTRSCSPSAGWPLSTSVQATAGPTTGWRSTTFS